MAHFRRTAESFSPTRTIRIIGSEYVDDHTVYVVEVSIGLYKWTVRHRYSNFFALHEKLVQLFPALDKNLLPKKKLFGNQTEQFILRRQRELEAYLQNIISNLPSIPTVLMKFLDFHRYEVHGITETLAEMLCENGDMIIQAGKTYHMNPLQLHAICTRMALPEPTCVSGDLKKDMGHVMAFVTNLHHLQIDGSALPIGRSNINMNELQFDLRFFQSLTTLEVTGCNMEKFSEVEHLKKNITYLGAKQCLSSLKEILLIGVWRGQQTSCDENAAMQLVEPWSAVRTANFSNNRINSIDISVKLMSRVEYVDLSQNRLESLDNLQHLSCLSRIDLSHNLIKNVSSLNTKLGNVTTLLLSHNKLISLKGFAKLYSLEVLDVSHNDISQIEDVKCIRALPCLVVLDLHNNAVTLSLDYRIAVFEMFAERVQEFCLDGVKPSVEEIDRVAIRCALSKSLEQRKSRKPARKAPVNEATIVDAVDSSVPDLPASNPHLDGTSVNVTPLSGTSARGDQSFRVDDGSTAAGKQADCSSDVLANTGDRVLPPHFTPSFPLGHLNNNLRKKILSDEETEGSSSKKKKVPTATLR